MAPLVEGPLPELPPVGDKDTPGTRAWLRRKMGISIRTAAKELGVSKDAYSFWERGLRTPHPGHHRAYHSQLSGWQEAIDKVV